MSIWVDGQTETQRKEREILSIWHSRYHFSRWGLKCWSGVVKDTGVQDLQVGIRPTYFPAYEIVSSPDDKILMKSVLSAPWSGSLKARTLMCWQHGDRTHLTLEGWGQAGGPGGGSAHWGLVQGPQRLCLSSVPAWEAKSMLSKHRAGAADRMCVHMCAGSRWKNTHLEALGGAAGFMAAKQ